MTLNKSAPYARGRTQKVRRTAQMKWALPQAGFLPKQVLTPWDKDLEPKTWTSARPSRGNRKWRVGSVQMRNARRKDFFSGRGGRASVSVEHCLSPLGHCLSFGRGVLLFALEDEEHGFASAAGKQAAGLILDGGLERPALAGVFVEHESALERCLPTEYAEYTERKRAEGGPLNTRTTRKSEGESFRSRPTRFQFGFIEPGSEEPGFNRNDFVGFMGRKIPPVRRARG